MFLLLEFLLELDDHLTRWFPMLSVYEVHTHGSLTVLIYRGMARLSLPEWLVTYQNGLPICRPSPIWVLTGLDIK